MTALAPVPSTGTLIGRALLLWRVQYRRTWRGSVVITFLTPLGYLAAMGLGLGSLVDESARASVLGGVEYLDFLAPGLLAGALMQQTAFDSTFPVLGAIKWTRQYQAQLATPLSIRDVLAGHLLWVAIRLGLSAAVFLGVMAAFGAVSSWTALLCIPAGVLTGMAFAPGIFAYAATLDSDSGFAVMFRFLVMPMFLFSGIFFPLSQLPDLLEPVAQLLPLWHGVDLCRALTLGTATWGTSLLHAAYLACWCAAGFAVGLRSFRRRLAT